MTQLWGAIEAVWRSWTLKKAVDYRRVNGISENARHRRERRRRWCSATSATTPAPASRSRAIRRPARRSSTASSSSTRRAKTSSPAFARRSTSTRWRRGCPRRTTSCVATQDRLEQHFRDMQDIEFTVERGKLYLLQTRTGQAHGGRGGAHRDRHGGRGAHRPRDRRAARRARAARPAAASGDRRRRSRDADLRRASRRVRAPRAASPCSIPTSPSSARRRASR